MKTALARCIELTRHFPSAHILYRVRYYVVTRGLQSAELTHAEWQEETGLTYEQVKDAFRRLRKEGHVTTQLTTRAKVVQVHLSAETRRKLAEVEGPNGPSIATPQQPHSRAKWHTKEGQMALQPNPFEGHMAHDTLYGEEVVGDKKEICDAAAPIAVKEAGQMKITGKTIAEVVAQASNPSREPLTKIGDVWRDAFIRQSETSWAPPLTIKDRGMLKKIEAGLPSKSGPEVIGFIVEGWPEFVAHVKSAAGIKTAPSVPSIPFLLKHVGQAYQLWYSAKTPMVATKMHPSAFTQPRASTAPVPVAPQPQDKPTLDDILAPYKPD